MLCWSPERSVPLSLSLSKPFPLLIRLISPRFLLSPPFAQASASSHTPPEVYSSAESLPQRGRSRSKGKRNAEMPYDLGNDGDVDEEDDEEKIAFGAA